MRIKNGKVRLDSRDVRTGNFVYTEEEDYVKLQDISRLAVQRVAKSTAKGQMLSMMLSSPDDNAKFLEAYAVVSFNFLGTVCDPQMLEEVNAAAVACLNRHKNIYGIKDDVSPEEDAAILREERELREAVEEISAAVSGGESEGRKAAD